MGLTTKVNTQGNLGARRTAIYMEARDAGTTTGTAGRANGGVFAVANILTKTTSKGDGTFAEIVCIVPPMSGSGTPTMRPGDRRNLAAMHTNPVTSGQMLALIMAATGVPGAAENADEAIRAIIELTGKPIKGYVDEGFDMSDPEEASAAESLRATALERLTTWATAPDGTVIAAQAHTTGIGLFVGNVSHTQAKAGGWFTNLYAEALDDAGFQALAEAISSGAVPEAVVKANLNADFVTELLKLAADASAS